MVSMFCAVRSPHLQGYTMYLPCLSHTSCSPLFYLSSSLRYILYILPNLSYLSIQFRKFKAQMEVDSSYVYQLDMKPTYQGFFLYPVTDGNYLYN